MKNIFLLSTDSSSKLFYLGSNLHLEQGQLISPKSYQHIYITSNEKPKKGEWSIYLGLQKKYKCIEDVIGDEFPKIILTTDPDLIKDGVQSIDDTFLEWFVKNPNCEKVEVETYSKKIGVESDANGHREMDIFGKDYRITIPKEEFKHIPYTGKVWEPKPDTLDEILPDFKISPMVFDNLCNVFDQSTKKETLEEAGQNYAEQSCNGQFPIEYTRQQVVNHTKNDFIAGAKYQAERSYSEEEVLELIQTFNDVCGRPNKPHQIKNWFNQFKKK
jgi:hypothetical protein